MRAFIFCFLLALGCFINSISAQSDSLITALEKTLQVQIDSLGEGHLDVAILCDSLGNIHLKASNYSQAIGLFAKALKNKLENLEDNHPYIADSYSNLGEVYTHTGVYKKAISYHKKALKIRLEVLNEYHPDIANSYHKLGNAYVYTGDYKKVDILFNKALKIRLKVFGENHPKVADSYHNLGILYKETGQYEKSIISTKQALNIRLDTFGEEHSDVADCYNNLGVVCKVISIYEEAITCHNKALSIRLQLLDEKHPHVAHSYGNLGTLYCEIGNYEKSIFFLDKALNIFLDIFGEKHPHTASSYNNKGIVYTQIGDYEKAINSYTKALNIWLGVFGEKHPSVATSYNNLGSAYQGIRDYQKMITFYTKALDIWLEIIGEKHPYVAGSYNNLGSTYQEMKDYKNAITFYTKAVNIWLSIYGKEHPLVAYTYSNIGALHYVTHNNDEAIYYYKNALNTCLNIYGEKHHDINLLYTSLAMAYEKNRNHNSADSLWHIAIPQSTELLKSTYLFLPDQQRIKYLNTLTPVGTNFYSFAAINGTESTRQLATDFLLNTKSLALDYAVSTRQIIREINDSTLTTQHEQINILNKKIADAEKLTEKERKEKGWNLSEIQGTRDALTSQILQHPQLKSKLDTSTIKWQDLQNHLASDEATIDFIKIKEKQNSLWAYYAIFIYKGITNPQFVRITDEKTLINLLGTDENKPPAYLNDIKTKKALYKVLWQPLEPYLEDTMKVHISPSGILHRVPFESLQDARDEFLATRYNFHYHSALRDILKGTTQKSDYKDIVLMGDIQYDLNEEDRIKYEEQEILTASADSIDKKRAGRGPLPGTKVEIEKIERICTNAGLKTTILTGDMATEDTVLYFVEKRAPDIIHIATHGAFLPPLENQDQGFALSGENRLRAADNPLQRSALLLYGANETWEKNRPILGSGEDGILTALEVTTLDLDKTNLVVLSACATGLGNVHHTEGIFGLQRAFKLAGVEHVIVSLWDVNDAHTKELMIKFYENLLEHQQAPATALRNAKHYRSVEDEAAPKYWAGFILIE